MRAHVFDHAEARQRKARHPALRQHAQALRNRGVVAGALPEGRERVDASQEGHLTRLLVATNLRVRDATLHLDADHDRERVVVLEHKVERAVGHRRVQAHLHVEARAAVGVTRDNRQPRKEHRAVQRARDLAGPAAQSVHQLAASDHRRSLEAVDLGAVADDGVEVEGLAGAQHVAVNLRGGHLQVVGAIGGGVRGVVARLEFAQHGVHRDAVEGVACALGLYVVHDGGDLRRGVFKGGVDAVEGRVDVQLQAFLRSHHFTGARVEPGVDRRPIDPVLERHQQRNRPLHVQAQRQRQVEGLARKFLRVDLAHR